MGDESGPRSDQAEPLPALDKPALRLEMLRTRGAIPPDERDHRGAAIVRSVLALDELAAARHAMAFWSFGSEVPTHELLRRLEERGISVLLPYLEDREMRAAPYRCGEPLVRTSYGPSEPALHREELPPPIDVVLVPGLAFDRLGNRLGYGRGYFDGFLRGLGRRPVLIGLGFTEQVVARVPVTPADVALDLVITDSEVIRCEGAGSVSR